MLACESMYDSTMPSDSAAALSSSFRPPSVWIVSHIGPMCVFISTMNSSNSI